VDRSGAARTRVRRPDRFHSDIEKGFIRAELCAYDDLVAAGNLGGNAATRQR